jgi:hypothetical protein
MPSKRELDHAYRLRRLQIIQNLGNQFFRTACVGLPSLFLWLSVRDLAGHQTVADIAFKAIADFKINQHLSQVLPWGATTAATGWAFGERVLRKRHIRRSAKEFAALHKKIDPARLSSSLTTEGDTSPEDL